MKGATLSGIIEGPPALLIGSRKYSQWSGTRIVSLGALHKVNRARQGMLMPSPKMIFPVEDDVTEIDADPQLQPALGRGGFVLGLATQPFGFYTSLRHRQSGIFIPSIFYALRRAIGVCRKFLRVLQSFEGNPARSTIRPDYWQGARFTSRFRGERPDHLTSPPHPFSPRAPALHCSCPQRPLVVVGGSTDII